MLLTNDEVAAMLRISPLTLKSWRNKNKGPKPYYLGDSVRYKPADVEEWLEANLSTTKPLAR